MVYGTRRQLGPWIVAIVLPLLLGLVGVATSVGEPVPKTVPAEHKLSGRSHEVGVHFGDAPLRGSLDLAKTTKRDGVYTVTLSHNREAILTLRPAVQEKAERVLKQARAPYAAIVVMAVDGRILALAGASRAEPNLSTIGLALKPWAPAASVFKIVTAAALIDAGVDPDADVCYHGGVRSVVASNLEDDRRRDRACHSLGYGLSRSQNAIVGKLAVRHLDPPTLRRYAARFGFDSAPDFALPATPSTTVIPEDKLEFARVAAGFWKTRLSPIGGAVLANTIASGGLSVTPRIVSSISQDGQEQPILSAAPRRVLEPETAAAVSKMMVETCSRGTAQRGFRDRRGRRYLPGIEIAGKTGSLSQDSPYVSYSWFVGFAPADNPRVVVAVLLGNGSLWHIKAHQAARMVLQTALSE